MTKLSQPLAISLAISLSVKISIDPLPVIPLIGSTLGEF